MILMIVIIIMIVMIIMIIMIIVIITIIVIVMTFVTIVIVMNFVIIVIDMIVMIILIFMIVIIIKEFNVPLDQCHWFMKWCKDVHNVLAMRKLGWRSQKVVLRGDTPDVSMFRFHTWEDTCYLDPNVKQPECSMLTRKFLCVVWSHGDALFYYVRTSPKNKNSAHKH